MLQLANNQHLWAMGLLVLLMIMFIVYLMRRKRVVSKLGKRSLIDKLSQSSNMQRQYVKAGLLFVGFFSLVIAWANPLLGTKFEKVKREGIDVVFAIDVSKSMNAEDVAPSRMLKAKQIVSNVIDEMSNDRIGLIVFAGNAYLQMPVTVDYSGARMYLKTVNTDMVPQQGTAISEAIDLALKSFDAESQGFKTLVVLSDGESHDGNAEAMAEKAREDGVVIHTVGVGTEQAARIPVDNQGNFKKDNQGEFVTTKLNEEMLQQIAKIGGGKYLNASSSDIYEDILLVLSAQEGRMIDEKVYTSFKNHFPIFLSIALVALLLEFLIRERKLKWLNW